MAFAWLNKVNVKLYEIIFKYDEVKLMKPLGHIDEARIRQIME